MNFRTGAELIQDTRARDLKNFGSSRDSLNPTLRPNLRPN